MIHTCPHCGQIIPEKLVDGLASCTKCQRIFDSSLHNRLLSASWLIRQHKCHSIEQLISDTKLPEHEAILVYSFVGDNCYSPNEFSQVLSKLGIKKR
jgi:hypothetical protein